MLVKYTMIVLQRMNSSTSLMQYQYNNTVVFSRFILFNSHKCFCGRVKSMILFTHFICNSKRSLWQPVFFHDTKSQEVVGNE